MQHTDDKQSATHCQVVITTNKTFFSVPSRLLFRWGGLARSNLHVAPRCHGNALFSHIPAPPFSVFLHPIASDPPALCGPINSLFFLLSSFTTAVTLLRPGSVLGCPAPRWPTSWERRCWTKLYAHGCDSWQGTVLNEPFLFYRVPVLEFSQSSGTNFYVQTKKEIEDDLWEWYIFLINSFL